MKRDDVRRVAELAVRLAFFSNDAVSAGAVADTAMRLFRISESVRRYDEKACNVGLDVSDELRVDRLVATAQKLAKSYGCTIRHQPDPRGCTLYLTLRHGQEVCV